VSIGELFKRLRRRRFVLAVARAPDRKQGEEGRAKTGRGRRADGGGEETGLFMSPEQL
jgi:hypothetical protein